MPVKPTQGPRMRWSLTVPPALALCALLGFMSPASADGLSWPERATAEGPAFETLNQWSIVPSSGAGPPGYAPGIQAEHRIDRALRPVRGERGGAWRAAPRQHGRAGPAARDLSVHLAFNAGAGS